MTVPLASPPRRRTPWEIQRAVLFAIFVRDLRARVVGRWSGLAWLFLEPMAHLLLLVVFFSYVRHLSSPNMPLPVFLIAGLMPFFLFRNLMTKLSESIEGNRALFSYRQVKPFDAVAGRGLVETVLWTGSFALTLLIMAWLGYEMTPKRPLELLAALGVMGLLGAGLGLLLAVLTHRQPRLRSVIRMLYLPLYFTSGVIFSVERLPADLHAWLLWNPLLHLVELTRRGFEPAHTSIDGIGFAYPSGVLLVLLAFAMAVYRRDRQKLLLGD